MLRRALAAILAILVAGLTADCGREDIQLLGAGDDAGGDGPGPTLDAALDGPLGADSRRGDDAGPLTCPSPSGRPCQENGGRCTTGVECCSSRCSGGVCLEPGACAGPGTACTDRSTCCSGRCEALAPSSARACLDYCAPSGSPCTQALDCCSTRCTGGACAPGLCSKEGDYCAVASDCCSNLCGGDSKCGLGNACRASEDDCSSGGGPGCCAGVACNSDGRCDFGPGPCRALGSPCINATDCCDGATCSMGVCTGACLADGTACTVGGDCCSGHCVGSPAVCGPAPTCKLTGIACGTDTECCSGQCLNWTCGSNCTP
jgi:hypothetical protein